MKKVLSVLLALAMVLSMVPVSVTAVGTVEASAYAGTHTTTGHTCDECGATEWQPWPTSGELPTEGHYYLTQNVEHTKMPQIPAGKELHLCLNGYVINKTTTNRIFSVAEAGAELVITDCTACKDSEGYHAGAITGGTSTLESGGGAIYVAADAVLKLYDGRITGNTNKHDSKGGGGAISLAVKSTSSTKGGSFYMYDGELSDNKSVKTNDTTYNGGAIYANNGAVVEITGGTIKNNQGNGGAVYAKNASVSISNVLITGNSGNNGGAIYAEGPLTIGDGTVITGNTGKSSSAGNSAAVLNAGANSKMTLTGKVIIVDNTMYTENIPDVVFKNADTDTLYIHNLTDGSRVVFATPATAATTATEVIKLDTAQTAPWQSGWVKWLSAVDGTGTLKDVGLVGSEFVFGHYHGSQEYTALQNGDQIAAGGHYYLAGDVTLDKGTKIEDNTYNLSLCLNGHNLTPVSGGRILETGDHDITRNIVIDDCTAYTDDSGVYHAGSITGANHSEQGGLFVIRRGTTLELHEGKLTGNQAGNGGAIMAWGTVKLFGGEISNNKAGTSNGWKNGGGIYINTKGTLIADGGTIKNNEAGSGGAIYVAKEQTLQLKDVTITGNKAHSYGGAIMTNKDCVVELSGATKIKDNTLESAADNLFIHEGAKVVPNGLTGVETIGVNLYSKRITAGALSFTDALTGDPSGSFFSDSSKYTVELKDQKLTLVEDNTTPPGPSEPTPEPHKHCVCGEHGCTLHGGQVEYQPWTNDKELPSEGAWYLDTDVTVESTVEYEKNANKALKLCLNNKTITQKSGTNAQMYEAKQDNSGVEITISDCQATGTGDTYSAGKITGFTVSNDNGAVMYMRKGATLNLYDGIICGNQTTKNAGGALMINGVFNMYGGELSGNSAGTQSNRKNAGAVYLGANALAKITGGTIKNNSGNEGGAIYIARDNNHIFENVTFSGNNAATIGGAITIGGQMAKGTTLKNCTFKNNTAGDKGGAIRVAGMTRLEGCTFTDNDGKGAVYVSNGADLTLAGANQITGNKAGNLYLEATETVNVESATGTVGVTAANGDRAFTGDCADLSANFASDDADYKVAYQEGKLWLLTTFEHSHCAYGDQSCSVHDNVEFQPWKDPNALPSSGGNYCLLTDVTLSTEYTVKSDMTLCLHGKTITTSAKKRLLSTNGEVTLTITDCTAKTKDGVYTAGKLTGGTDTSSAGGGAIFVRRGGTLNLYDGIITGNKTLYDGAGGGAIMLQSKNDGKFSSFYMYDGEISGNKACSADGTADRSGGGVYAYTDSVFVMEGGTIKNNEAGTGSGVYARGCQMTMAGGEISGNKASMQGGGVQMAEGATMALSGKVTIIGNTAKDKASNLCLEGEQKIKMGTLDQASKVAVSGQPLAFFTDKCDDYSACFLSDNSKYSVAYKEGALYMDAAGNHKHCFCAAASGKCDHAVQTYVEWDDPTALPTSGNYYLSVDVVVDAQITLNATELNLCLNGHTITTKAPRVFYTKGNAILRISDCTGNNGKLTGGKNGAFITENVAESKAVTELYGGIITGNENTSLGGGVMVQGGATFNMYGGIITGNALHCKLKTDADGKVVLNEDGSQDVTSERGGGGVGVYGKNATFNMYGGEISNNETTRVIYLDKDGKSAQIGGYGGGVYAYYGTVNLYGGKITGNKAEGHGGGIFTIYTKLLIDGCEISNNETGASGGAAYCSTGSKVDLKSGDIKNNKAATNAGAMVAGGKATVLTITGGKITGNQSGKTGGGLVAQSKAEVVMNGGEISGNNAGGSAGGALIQSEAKMTMTGGQITGNYAKSYGGGLYISTNAKLNMSGGSITKNIASQAGGLYLSRATTTITGGSISYNTAEGTYGGGIKQAGGTLTASGLKVIGNKAKKSGGGMVTTSITKTENGVKTTYYVTCNLYGCTFADNVAEAAAGGLLQQSKGTVANVQNCTFTGNKATSSGGGMYASSGVTINVKGCKFIGNEAAAGGGFRLSNCTAKVEDVVVAENVGQGVSVYGKTCNVELKNLDIYKNTHGSAAGIQFNTGATGTLSDSRVYENSVKNTAAGVYIGNACNITLKNVEIFQNTAGMNGAGFYTGAGSRAVAEGLIIRDNTASELGGGVYTCGDVTMTDCTITGNTAGINGGGIHTWKSGSRLTGDDAGLKLFNTKVMNNETSGQGGGIYVFRGGPAKLSGTTVADNKAKQEGGGIYCDGRMELWDVTVTGNTSGGAGYALYLTPMEWDGHSYTAGYKSIGGDTIVKDNENGDMYMDVGTVAAVNGPTLGDKSVINVTLSDGVLTQRVIGVYNYEGSDLNYTLTAGDRSITEPMEPESKDADSEKEALAGLNTLLYIGIGVFVIAVAAVAIIVLKKKKAGKPAEEVNKE